MPLDTTTYDIDAEIESLESDREEFSDQLVDVDPESNAAQQLVEKGQRTDRYLSGLAWYREEYGDTLELGALTNGERHRVRDVAEDIGAETAGRQNAYVAMGTLDAGYLQHTPPGRADADDPFRLDEYKDTIVTVADLHPAFVDWAEGEITQLGRMDGDTGKSFERLVLEKRIQAASPETNG